MNKTYVYIGVITLAATVAVSVSFVAGRSTGYERGIFESELSSASVDALRTLHVLELLDAHRTSDAQALLNLHLDESLLALDTLTQSPFADEAHSSARESLRLAIAYRKAHAFDGHAGAKVTERIRQILAR
jgi:hypothetical protein